MLSILMATSYDTHDEHPRKLKYSIYRGRLWYVHDPRNNDCQHRKTLMPVVHS